METKRHSGESLPVLILRAVVVTLSVTAILLSLRLGGVTCVEPDMPAQMVEGIVQMAGPDA